jgi:hypothetical protein
MKQLLAIAMALVIPVAAAAQEPARASVRVMAHDGGLATTADVNVRVE